MQIDDREVEDFAAADDHGEEQRTTRSKKLNTRPSRAYPSKRHGKMLPERKAKYRNWLEEEE